MSQQSYSGLSPREVEESRAKYGVNILTPPKKKSVLTLFLAKFRDPLIIILLIAGALSIGISMYEYYGLGKGYDVFIEPIGIFAAIILATGLGFYFEYRAEKEFAVLNRMTDDEPVQAIRSGNPTTVARKDIVVGDIIMLQTGEEIPADARLLESTRLSVDESTLTGEPMCHKNADPAMADKDATFPTDMVMRGTKVIEGHGIAQVTAVGDSTESGKVFEASRIDNSVRTPLDEQLDRLGSFITRASYLIGALVIAGRLTMYFTANGSVADWMDFTAYLLQSVMLAVTLIVCSVPEGLPMAVTLALAYSMRRMIRTDNLVRKMHACETMGAVTVICTDKTGTLTANRMQVQQLEFLSSISPQMAMIDMALNSTAELDMTDRDNPSALGNPTEGALLLWINSRGEDYRMIRSQWQRESELPFTTERKYMATVITDANGHRRLIVKGAPEIVYGMCNHSADKFTGDQLTQLLRGYQLKAMRTLGFASCDLNADQHSIGDDTIKCQQLQFDMVAAISDPVREDVPQAVRDCLDAGIKIKVVTGDTPATATEISRQIGLWVDGDDTDNNITTGDAIAAMTDDELRRNAPKWKIIARARPMDKRRLVEALQSRGEVVAVTGDGTNDAPALKAAHVGLSMGDGTAVAKEASDITILNNSFSGITNAVVWGRSLYLNIQRFILFQLTVNLAACLTVLIGSFMGTESPLTVTQMLWINLIMDTFAAMALASLPPSRSVLNQPPRDRHNFIISPAMGRFVAIVGTLFGLVMLTTLYIMEHSSISHPLEILTPAIEGSRHLSTYELSIFFTLFIMLQMWNLFNARAFGSGRSAFHLAHCSEFIVILLTIFIGQVAIVSIGGEFFNVSPISARDWLVIIVATSPVVLIGELIRAIGRYRRVKEIKTKG